MKKNLRYFMTLLLMMVASVGWGAEKTGTITFGNNGTKINGVSVTGDDDLGNTWTVTTVGTTSFTASSDYYQVGSSKNPATSITFTTTLSSSQTIKSMSAKFGGFSGTAGTVTLKVGDTTIGTGSLNETQDVTVQSTSTAQGTVLTVTVTGIAKGVKCYNISYTYDDGEATIPVTGVTLDKSTANIYVGETETLTATVAPDNATNNAVTWSSNNEAVATVSDGVVTGVAAGTATITVTTVDGGKTATCTVTVTPVEVTEVTLNKEKTTIAAGEAETLTATVAPDNATNKAVTWSSSNEAVATVSDGVVTGVAAGTATITVTTVVGGKTATCTVTVTANNNSWVETSLADLTSSDVFVIVGNNGDNYAMSNNNGTSSAPTAVEVTVAEGKITSIVSDNIKWTVSGNATDGYTFYPNGSTEKWLYCNTTASTSNNNNMRVGTGDRKLFVLDNDGYAKTKDTHTARYISIYNDIPDWRGYVNTNSAPKLKFYKRADGTTTQISASDVDLAHDATEGSISYRIINPVTGTSLTASVTDGSWLALGTIGESSIPFTCSDNEGEERTATVTLTYGDITKTVTITQAAAPVVYTTIPALFEAATSTDQDVTITFNNWVVSGVSGSNVFVTDGTNGFIIYQSGHGFEVGNTLSGTASCKLVLYRGSAELMGLKSTSDGLTVGNNGTVTASTVEMANLAGVNTGSLVSYKNLTCSVNNSKYYLTDGTTTIQVYNSLYDFDALEDGKKYNITGIYQQYNSTKEVMPRRAEDIVEVSSITITISDARQATFSSTKTYAIPDGLTAYVVTAYSKTDNNVTLTPLTSVIPANTGVVVKGNAGTYELTESSESENIATNYLKANVTPYNLPAEEVIDGENYYNYTLAADGFKHSSGNGTLDAGKAYLQIPYNVTTNAKLSLVYDGEGTGINNVNANDNANNKIFNLSGQRVGASFKGLMIKNGKKYINK